MNEPLRKTHHRALCRRLVPGLRIGDAGVVNYNPLCQLYDMQQEGGDKWRERVRAPEPKPEPRRNEGDYTMADLAAALQATEAAFGYQVRKLMTKPEGENWRFTEREYRHLLETLGETMRGGRYRS